MTETATTPPKNKKISPYTTTPLEYLFYPSVSCEEFESSIWSKKHLYIPGDKEKWSFLLNWDILNELLNQDAFHSSSIQFSKLGKIIDLNIKHPIKKRAAHELHSQIYDHLDSSYTLIMNQIQYKTASLIDFTQALSYQVGEYVRMNSYCSLKSIEGFPVHFDKHDVIVVQLEGEKTWYLYGMKKQRPNENQLEKIVQTKKGDTLYIPRNLWHKAVGNGPSYHATISINSFNYSVYLHWIIKEISKEMDLQKYLPLRLRKTPSMGYRKEDIQPFLNNLQNKLSKKILSGELIEDFNTETIFHENTNTHFHIPQDVQGQAFSISRTTQLFRSRYQRYFFKQINSQVTQLTAWRLKIHLENWMVPIFKFIFEESKITGQEIMQAVSSSKWAEVEKILFTLVKHRILSLSPYDEKWPIY